MFQGQVRIGGEWQTFRFTANRTMLKIIVQVSQVMTECHHLDVWWNLPKNSNRRVELEANCSGVSLSSCIRIQLLMKRSFWRNSRQKTTMVPSSTLLTLLPSFLQHILFPRIKIIFKRKPFMTSFPGTIFGQQLLRRRTVKLLNVYNNNNNDNNNALIQQEQ